MVSPTPHNPTDLIGTSSPGDHTILPEPSHRRWIVVVGAVISSPFKGKICMLAETLRTNRA